MPFEWLGGVLICGLALVPLAALVLVLNLWQRVQRLERDVAVLKGATSGPRPTPADSPPVSPQVGRPVPVPAPAPSRTAALSTATPGAATPGASMPGTATPAAVIAGPATAPASAPISPTPSAPVRRGGGFERMLGTRGLLWVGAILIALAGVFFFKWAIDNGWFGETARVVTGIVFGLGALGVAERIRGRSRSVAGGTAAAGIAVLYTTFVVATNVYEILPVAIGGLCMAATTAAAVALSLRYGPVIVIIGMIGGFLTPALLDVPDPSPLRLFGYLALLQLGVAVVARKRDWWWAGLTVMAGGAGWFVLWLLGGTYDPDDGTVLGLFALFGAATTIAAASRVGRGGEAWSARREAIAVASGWAGAIYGAFLVGISLDTGGYRMVDWLFIALLGAGALALGWLRADWDRVPWLTATLTVLLLSIAAQDSDVPVWLVLAFGVLYTAGGYAIGWRAARPDRWAILVAGVFVGYFVVAHMVLWLDGLRGPNGMPVAWGVVATALAVVLAVAAVPIGRRRARVGGGSTDGSASITPAVHDRALAALAIGVVALLALGVAIDLDDWWLAAGLAVLAAAACWTAMRLRLPALAHTAWPLAVLATLRLVVPPTVGHFPISTRPILNAALLGYGVPIVAFVAAARWTAMVRGAGPTSVAAPDNGVWRRPFAARGEAVLSEALRWMALVLTVVLAHVLIGHGFHGTVGLWGPGEGPLAIVEWTLHVIVPLGLALALRAAAARWPWRAVVAGGWLLAWAGLAMTVGISLFLANPLFRPLPVGPWPVMNWLVLAYGAPAVLCVVLARAVKSDGPRSPLLWATGVLIGILGFVLLSLEVRQAFHGSVLAGGETTSREMYSYSLAWTLYGIALLGLGIVRKLPAARYASLAVMIVTVCKVFLFDVAGLTGLYRVFSFLGLGVSLLGLAYVYQRLVFNVAPEEEA